jgi:uncharacterized protein GlcG (DUF336 family)
MTDLTQSVAQSIVAAALAHGRDKKLLPLAVSVLDARGALKAFVAEDGTSLKRGEIAIGKAHGALALGMGSRALMKRANDQPTFIAAMSHIVGGSLVPVPGGVLIRDAEGKVIGGVGISGDTSDNDEAAALAGIAASGLKADPGAG